MIESQPAATTKFLITVVFSYFRTLALSVSACLRHSHVKYNEISRWEIRLHAYS